MLDVDFSLIRAATSEVTQLQASTIAGISSINSHTSFQLVSEVGRNKLTSARASSCLEPDPYTARSGMITADHGCIQFRFRIIGISLCCIVRPPESDLEVLAYSSIHVLYCMVPSLSTLKVSQSSCLVRVNLWAWYIESETPYGPKVGSVGIKSKWMSPIEELSIFTPFSLKV